MIDQDDAFQFRATFQGAPQTIGHATTEEIAALAGQVGVDAAHPLDDVLDSWSLVAIRSVSATTVHALGWRRRLANTWITSKIVALSTTEGAVRTTSGAAYFLADPDQHELHPKLRAHLIYALTTWGYKDVLS